MTSNYVPGLRLEFARFYGETGHFNLNFSVENSNFSQFFVSGIHIHTFFHNFAEKKISFHRHFKSISTRRNFRAERHFLLFKDQQAENERQKTKENIPRGKFRLLENSPY